MDALPHDLDAERYILGAALLKVSSFDDMRHALTPSDFYVPDHQALWFTLNQLRDDGGDIGDLLSILDAGKRHDLKMTGPELNGLMLGCPASSGYAAWVRLVLRWAVYRRVLHATDDIKMKAQERLLEADDLLDLASAAFTSIDRPGGTGEVSGLFTFDEFLDGEDKAEPFLIPGLICRSWRAMIVAPEGVGKSMVARAIVIGAGQGIGPFGGSKFEPCRALLVDCENGASTVRNTTRPIRAAAKMSAADYADWRTWIWHRPGGINVRTRQDRQDLERVIAAAQPDIVCMGPMYKVYRPGRDGDEQAGLDVMNLLDELRTRYGFALILEHHAPKAQGPAQFRELVPYGTSLWMRWVELGLQLKPSEKVDGSLELGRFRPDRVECNWPSRLDRGMRGNWPWVGRWDGAMP